MLHIYLNNINNKVWIVFLLAQIWKNSKSYRTLKKNPLLQVLKDYLALFLLIRHSCYRKALVRDRHGVDLEIHPTRPNGNYTIESRKGKHILKVLTCIYCTPKNYIFTLQVTPEYFASCKHKLVFSCNLENNRREDEIYLMSALVLHPYSCFSVRDPKNNIENGKILKILPGKGLYVLPDWFQRFSFLLGSSYEVLVEFDSKNQAVIGSYNIPVAFNIQVKKENCFTIARSMVSNEISE